MTKILAPHSNSTLKPVHKALFVLRPWTLIASKSGWKVYRDLIVHYRANPRSTQYMLEQAHTFAVTNMSDAKIDLYIHKDISEEVTKDQYSWINSIVQAQDLQNMKPNQYDTIVFLYADAIGLGWGNFENQIRKLLPNQFIIINGRRRIFLWDDETRRKLNFRRFMSQAWWWEWLFAPWLYLISATFFIADIIHPKKAS